MLFVILGFDGPEGAAKRPLYRPAHLARIEALDAERRVLLAGPLTDGAGSLIVMPLIPLPRPKPSPRKIPVLFTGSLNESKFIRSCKSFQR